MHSLHATKKLARLLGRQIGHDSCTKLVSLKLRSHYLLDSWIFRKLSFSSSSFLLACLIASYRVYLLTYVLTYVETYLMSIAHSRKAGIES